MVAAYGQNPACAMVVAAHPDDETLGAGATLTELPGAVVVHVTDGAPSDPRWFAEGFTGTRFEYAAARRLELARAMRIAGVPPERQLWLGASDLEASSSIAPLARELLALVGVLRPSVVITHAYEGGHPDHDATAIIARSALVLARQRGIAVRLLEMACYHGASGELVSGELLPGAEPVHAVELAEPRRTKKQLMLDCFATQRATLAPLGCKPERFRAAARYDFTKPPHDGTLYYERRGWMEYARFRELARAGLTTLGIEPASCR